MSYLQNFKFEIHGPEDAARVVCLHGVMGSGANWRKVTSQLKSDYRTLVFDQRGHGWSFKPTRGYGPDDYAQDLFQILEELGWDRIHLVGHSMGGRNALRFAHRWPERLHTLTIEDIGPQGNRQAMDRTLRLLDLVPTPFPDKLAAKKFFESEFLGLIKNHPQKEILGPYLLTNIEELPDGTADWRFFKDGIIESLRAGHFETRWEEVQGLNCPTLWIRGEHSDDLPPEEFTKILWANSLIRGAVIAGAGHWVHSEKPKEFVEVLRGFLADFDKASQAP